MSGMSCCLISMQNHMASISADSKTKSSKAVLLKRVAIESIESCEQRHVRDFASIKSCVKSNVSGYLYKTTKCSPMVLPVICEV